MADELLLATRGKLLVNVDTSIPSLQRCLSRLPDRFTLCLLVTAHYDVHPVVFEVRAVSQVTLTNAILVLVLSRGALHLLLVCLVQDLRVGLRTGQLSVLHGHKSSALGAG